MAPQSSYEAKFQQLSKSLITFFPDLELKFGISAHTDEAFCLLGEENEHRIAIQLSAQDLVETLHGAILSIKELARRFDS